MKKYLSLAGSLVGWTGVLICFLSGVARILGFSYLLDHEIATIFIVGIAMVATGGLAKLEAQTL